MKRRSLLRTVGFLGISGLVGCADLGMENETESSATPSATVMSTTPTVTPTAKLTQTPESAGTTSSPTPPSEEVTATPTPTPTPAPPPIESAKLSARDGQENDRLGAAVSVNEDSTRVLVGVRRDDNENGTEAGGAYVFARHGGTWEQAAKLVPTDGDSEDWFGWDVALSADGTRALVSAYSDEDPAGRRAGAAYAFERVDDTWEQTDKFVGSDTDNRDRFGSSVALAERGTTALVGAWRLAGDSEVGAAYVFEPAGDDWEQTARLEPDFGETHAAFGRAVALTPDGQTALVGADNEQGAYVFERSGGTWDQQTRLFPPRTDEDYRFGVAVALTDDGQTALVGASLGPIGASDGDEEDHGYATLYERGSDRWDAVKTFEPREPFPGDKFGASVALSADGTAALVGAPNSNRLGENSGTATLYRRADDGWAATKLAASDTGTYDDFGSSVALSANGDMGIVTAQDETVPNGENSGAAYVFDSL